MQQQGINQSASVNSETPSLATAAFTVGDQSFTIDLEEGQILSGELAGKAPESEGILSGTALPKISAVSAEPDLGFEIGVSLPSNIGTELGTQFDVMLRFDQDMAGEFPNRREFLVSSAEPIDVLIPAEYLKVDSDTGSIHFTRDFNFTIANGIIHCTVDGDGSPHITRFDDAPIVLPEGTEYPSEQYRVVSKGEQQGDAAVSEAAYSIAV